jgi:hypothetical protein
MPTEDDGSAHHIIMRFLPHHRLIRGHQAHLEEPSALQNGKQASAVSESYIFLTRILANSGQNASANSPVQK